MICPFCGKAGDGEYEMLVHMESFHPEDGRPPSPTAGSNREQHAECPMEGCGELVSLAEMDYHVDLHLEEQRGGSDSPNMESIDGAQSMRAAATGASPSSPVKDGHSMKGKQRSAIEAWGKLLFMPSSRMKGNGGDKRLGKAELGKYAHEQQMPDWLVNLLHKGGEVKNDGVITVLEQVLRQSKSTENAYLCSPAVQHVSKLKKEGGFCGYRNIQMMVSYIVGANAYGKEHFHGRLPTIFEIQDLIERAWDRGINAQGRLETGGIKGTRKYIGTPEKDGSTNLLVFDPMFHDPPALSQLIGQTSKHKSSEHSLKLYRRGAKYLRRYREFEILK
ncbi:Zinc finger with UFM1-specific peptidase domain protein [Colletotrichum chlorophyti]|uniref:Zinc finger with UFM1-specific peptidase domain protein n=1 Tax=Colletotrichum chlorophyti TaxID=708187 RepID=A0A1Q8S221_9PEZI|nr:Zinc finger with UFM1-specific peptidase domain protein [Colletotrichum chlorophyti]